MVKWYVLLFAAAASSIRIHDVLSQLRQEKETWQLVSTLYRDRLNTSSSDVIKDVTVASPVSRLLPLDFSYSHVKHLF